MHTPALAAVREAEETQMLMTWTQRIRRIFKTKFGPLATGLLVRDALQSNRQRGDFNTKMLFDVMVEIGVRKSGVMTCNQFVEVMSALETFNDRSDQIKIVDSDEDPWGA